MATNNINLGSIDYEQIKKSLTDYLKNQDTLKDYNFEGSALQSIISLLSYNTLYYAMYSNMLANEMFLDSAQREESIVSLLKPLGVAIPTKTSSRVMIRTGGTNFISKYSQFTGKNSSGVIYNFYTLDDYSSDVNEDDFIDNITLVEGKQLVSDKNITNLINYTDQTYFIPDLAIDISTLIVEVDKGDGVFKRWKKLDNIGDSTENLSQDIFFIERYDTGFEIQFGIENSLGNEIKTSYNTRISYIVSSGSAANNIINFAYPADSNVNIELYQASYGGLDSANLDYYKFVGPKFFASQNRAITKNDFLAISMEYLKNKGYDVTKDNFSVFGGDELFPPKYGRVFIATDIISTPDIQDLVAYLKSKCTVTVLPEYVESSSDTLTYDLSVKLLDNAFASELEKQKELANIRSYLLENHTVVNKYNIDFKSTSNDIINRFKVRSASIQLNYSRTFNTIDESGLNINLENKLNISVNNIIPITDPFVDTAGRTIQLRANPTQLSDLNTFIDLTAYVLNSSGNFIRNASIKYGRININNGQIQINKVTNNPIKVYVDMFSDKFVSGTNTKFSILLDKIIEV